MWHVPHLYRIDRQKVDKYLVSATRYGLNRPRSDARLVEEMTAFRGPYREFGKGIWEIGQTCCWSENSSESQLNCAQTGRSIFLDIWVRRADADAGSLVARFDLDQLRRYRFAFGDGVLAAGVEMAARRRVDR